MTGMKNKHFYLISFLVVFIIAGCLSPLASADEKKIKLTTEDLHVPYIIQGIVVYRATRADLEDINKNLIDEAKKLEADCVIGVRYAELFGYVFGYGTAVKVKEQIKE